MSVKPINLAKLESVFSQLDLAGVGYGLGAKAELKRWNPRAGGELGAEPDKIDFLDCSGWVRYGIWHSTDGGLLIPDGSQNQREWCEDVGLHKVGEYGNVNRYMNDRRLFIGFIKPREHGCGKVGHVWFVSQYDKDKEADTMESHGGVGINSRAWDYRTLRNQVYSCFELPVV